jgi:hypothetical protein
LSDLLYFRCLGSWTDESDDAFPIGLSLGPCQAAFVDATEEKTRVEAEAKACLDKLSLAERLTNGLASENLRW